MSGIEELVIAMRDQRDRAQQELETAAAAVRETSERRDNAKNIRNALDKALRELEPLMPPPPEENDG